MTFDEYPDKQGWAYLEEWIPAWEDEDGWHDGFLARSIWKEVLVDGVWFFQTLDVPEDGPEEGWTLAIKLGEAGLARTVQEHACR